MQTKKLREKVLFVSVKNTASEFVLNTIEHLGFEPDHAETIDAAKGKILDSTYKMILAEKSQSDGDGFDVLNFVRGMNTVPFLLISDENTRPDQDGHELLNFVSLARPFREADLEGTIDKMLRSQLSGNLILNGARYDNVEEEFSIIDIEEFVTGREIRFDIFINIGERKFIKLAHGSESLTGEQIERLKLKGVNSLYMRKKDFTEYLSMTVSLIRQMPKVRIPASRKSQFVQVTSRLLTESIVSREIDAEAVSHANAVVESTIEMLTGCDEILLTLEFLKNGHQDVYSHSLNVALYSVMIARNVRPNTYTTLATLAAGSMFHDLGKSKVPGVISEIPTEELSESEILIAQNHVVYGIEVLRLIKEIPKEVITIIEQHHEDENGGGYPLGLDKQTIHPLAKIVKVADDFCDMMAGKPPSLTYILHTIKMMERNSAYDPECVQGLKDCFTKKKNRAA